MNAKTIRNSAILIALAFIAAIVLGILSRPKIDTHEITDYLENMAPVAQAHSVWLEDYVKLTELYAVMSQSQKIEALNKLLNRMEEIQINIEESTPPEILAHIITKWENECRLILQAIFLLAQGIDRNNIEWIGEAYELLQEAEHERVQWKDELLNLLDDNGIETEGTPLGSFFN